MANFAAINKKIKSIKTTAKITNALKVVSSNKSVVYRELQRNSYSYLQGIYKIFFELYNSPEHDIRETNKSLIKYAVDRNELWIVLGTDIGMCGDFNERVRSYLEGEFDREYDGLIIMGTKLIHLLRREYGKFVELQRRSEISVQNLMDEMNGLTQEIFKIFFNRNYKRLTFVYVKDPKEGIIERVNILPFTEKYFLNRKKIYVRRLNNNLNYPRVIIDLFPSYLECVLLGGIITSKVSEHNIRRDLMHSATKNANELLEGYILTYNKLRQSNITQEITEIVAAVQSKKK